MLQITGRYTYLLSSLRTKALLRRQKWLNINMCGPFAHELRAIIFHDLFHKIVITVIRQKFPLPREALEIA